VGIETDDNRRAIQIVENYIGAIESGDLEKIVGLFSSDGFIYTPIQGQKLPPKKFFEMVFSATTEVRIGLLDVFTSVNGRESIAAYFDYEWNLPNGEHVSFKLVDVLKLSLPDGKIKSVTAIYDTHPIRGIGTEYKVMESAKES